MVAIRVKGGTGAGIRQPLKDPRGPWRCDECSATNKGYHARCMTAGCNRKRP